MIPIKQTTCLRMPHGRQRHRTVEDYAHYHPQLLLSLCIITLTALFLPGLLANGASDQSCLALSSPRCANLRNTTLFPFVALNACGNVSTFGISGCTPPEKKPLWSGFVHATPGNPLGPPMVKSFYSSFNATNSLPISGLINLTWSENLTRQPACQSGVSPDQITRYIPQFISLTSFASSTFQLMPMPLNIILFFNCNASAFASRGGLPLLKDSPACRSYRNACNLDTGKEKSLNCYQYAQDSKELNLSKAIESAVGCERAMFFATANLSISALHWTPGLIQLNWSTADDNSWIARNMKLCEGCLQTNGTCGYDANERFQCFCSGIMVSVNDCSAVNEAHSGCWNFNCRVGQKVAFGAAGFALALLLSLVLFCIVKRKRANTHHTSPHMTALWMKKPSFLSRKQDPILAKEISYEEIMHATESFAETHMLGDGGFGAVYKGVLADGRKVAVKRLYHDNCRRMEHFYNEIKVLSNLSHPNLVELYGFCCEDGKELLLVFEYAPQGTVSNHLHNSSRVPMPWSLRLSVACETANALSYLHNSVVPPIYHRDVKTTNILLDEGLHVKLADFGLSKFVPLKVTHVSTAPQGTPGYLDPDYHQCYQLTDKSDVYSFGVVLMELLSAKLAVDMSRDRGEINLSTLAIMKIKCGQLEELVDPALEMKKNPCVERSINRVVEVAFQCLHAERDERPSMCLVAEMLNDIRREHAGNGVGEHLPNNAHTTTLATSQSCTSNGLNKPFHHNEDSPDSVLFSGGSSNPSSTLST